MDVIQHGSEDIHGMAALSCCWPPGTVSMQQPESE